MDLYILEGKGFVKIGISENIENRLASYKDIKRKKVFNNLDFDVARYIENKALFEFSSDTEYLYNVNFEEVLDYVNTNINSKIKTFYFKPLGLELKLNEDGYYDLNEAIAYVNNQRAIKGRSPIFPADYAKTKSTKEFLNILESEKQSIPFISKAGKYGGTYAIPYAVLDFLMWSDVSIKVNVLSWMYYDREDYVNFCNAS